MKLSDTRHRTLVLLAFIIQVLPIAAAPCKDYGVTHLLQNDTMVVEFASNAVLKTNRQVRCTFNASFEPVNGCTHSCKGLEFGQNSQATLQMQYDNGTIDTCSIDYAAPLQPAGLAFLGVVGDRVRLGILRPKGSFDYVVANCPSGPSHTLFNRTSMSNEQMISVNCPLIEKLPLMSFVIETFKTGHRPAVKHITQEIPLPVPFTYELQSSILTVSAEPPPLINLNSSYEFDLIFNGKGNTSNTYGVLRKADLNPTQGSIFQTGLIPNYEYTIIFLHKIPSLGYTQSNATVQIVSNDSYPYPVKNVNLYEEEYNVIVMWDDPHHSFDEIEFSVTCETNGNATEVFRNTTFDCPRSSLDLNNTITITTHVIFPDFSRDLAARVSVNARDLPKLPAYTISGSTETSLTLRRPSGEIPSSNSSVEYRIQCDKKSTPIPFDIRASEYLCQSLEPGLFYFITLFALDTKTNIERSVSVYDHTLLEKCQYKSHFYSPDSNGQRSLVIEWVPPTKNFETVRVFCAPTTSVFEVTQLRPTMFVKCSVTSGKEFSVTIATIKRGFAMASLVFTDKAPDANTTCEPTTIPTQPPGVTTAPVQTNITGTGTGTTATPSRATATISTRAPVTSSTDGQSDLVKSQAELTQWRTYALIAFFVAAFFILATLCLLVLCITLCVRNR